MFRLYGIVAFLSLSVLAVSGLAADIDMSKKKKISSLLPTKYHIAIEGRNSCEGKYRGDYYDGSERKDVLDREGNIIKTVCERFYWELLMEGSGVLKSERQGDFITVNYDGYVGKKKDKDYRFREITNGCKYGEGVQHGLCLIPYHTIAADLKKHKVGDIIFIKRVKGLKKPDGTTHNGVFVVRDTGGAFNGIGRKRVDLFVGLEIDHDNIFSRAGFHHKKPEQAYKLHGKSKKSAKEWFASTFPELWGEQE